MLPLLFQNALRVDQVVVRIQLLVEPLKGLNKFLLHAMIVDSLLLFVLSLDSFEDGNLLAVDHWFLASRSILFKACWHLSVEELRALLELQPCELKKLDGVSSKAIV